MGGRKDHRMFEKLLSIVIAFAFCSIFLSLITWCKAQNEIINHEEELDAMMSGDLSDDLLFGKPYEGWTDEQIESYELNHLRSDILGY